MYKICRQEHDLIVDLKLAILDVVRGLQRQEHPTLMPRLLEVFDAIPLLIDNFTEAKCKNCVFPACKTGRMLTMALTWVKSGKYREGPLEVELYKVECPEEENRLTHPFFSAEPQQGISLAEEGGSVITMAGERVNHGWGGRFVGQSAQMGC
ncbi:MAG: hypothetical protein G8345_01110 [Magnetococcales bacterium]|nr:hypothetical protein [Magnetococcales bacterium]NGZ25469.1 hypothetical protein [Magnetococcales bacterium]